MNPVRGYAGILLRRGVTVSELFDCIADEVVERLADPELYDLDVGMSISGWPNR